MMSLSTKIFIVISLMLALFLVAASFTLWRTNENRRSMETVSEKLIPLYVLATRLDSEQSNMTRSIERLLDFENDQVHDEMFRVHKGYFPARLGKNLQRAEKHLAQLKHDEMGGAGPWIAEMETRYRQIHTLLNDYNGVLDDYFERLKSVPPAVLPSGGTLPENAAEAAPMPGAETELNNLRDKLKSGAQNTDREIQLLVLSLENQIQKTNAALVRSGHRTQLGILFFFGAILLLGVIFLFHTHRILTPLRQLTLAVKEVSGGEFGRTVPVRSRDEVGMLAREFNRMAQSLRERDEILARQNQRLLQTERLAAIGKLSTQIAHEIRNPLNSMGLNMEMLLDLLPQGRDAEATQKLVQAMQKEIDRLTEITQNYLRFAKLPQLEFRETDAAKWLPGLVDFVQEEFNQKQVRLKQEFQGAGFLRAFFDPGQLRQALLNLLLNALESCAAGNTVELRARVLPADPLPLQLEVADDGPGISESNLAHIFDPFFTTKIKGTGLGLSIAHQVITAHQGTIECTSAPGKGACFTIRLPLRQPPLQGV